MESYLYITVKVESQVVNKKIQKIIGYIMLVMKVYVE